MKGVLHPLSLNPSLVYEKLETTQEEILFMPF